MHAFVTSHVDYCNSLLYGLHVPAPQLHGLACFKHCSKACLVCFRHITPLMYGLHWLPLQQCIHFKTLLFAFKAIHGIAPTCIYNLVSLKSQGTYMYYLRLSGGILLPLPTFRTKVTLGPSRWRRPSYGMHYHTSFATFRTYILLNTISRCTFLSSFIVK